MKNQTSNSAQTRPWRNFSFTVLACLASSALLSAACSGTVADDMGMGSGGTATDTGGAPAATGGGTASGGGSSCDVPDLLNKKCGSSICHGTPGDLTTVPSGSVNLLAPGVEGRIYGVDAKYANIAPTEPMNCPTPAEKLLDPAGLPTSLMYTKVNGGHICGASMPNIGTMTAEQISCYNDWLAGIIANPPQ